MKENICNKFKSHKEKLFLNVFLLPSVAGCLLFIFIPSIFSFLLSFFKWNLISKIKFIGLDNYIELFKSDIFWEILKNTLVYAFFVTLFATIIPLVLASVLNNKIRGTEIYKTTYFLPFITPMIVIALIWQWIFDPNIGLINTFFKIHQTWLYNSDNAMNVLIFISVWKLMGYNTVIFLSGFAAINNQVYEAAKIDGADVLRTFTRITLPLMSPSVFFVILITTISSFQVFDLIYLLSQGGPDNSTNVLVYWLYKNAFEYFNIGKASAIAYILFVLIFVLTIIQWEMRTTWVLTEKDN